jgi:hypothetical protein
MAFADADQRATQGFRIVTASVAAVDHYFSMIVEFSSQGYSPPYVGLQSAGATSFQSELTSAYRVH